MSENRIGLFAYRPEQFQAMGEHLTEMLGRGWRLRWCRGIFAGYARTEDRDGQYIVDPYAMTSFMNLRRYPYDRRMARLEDGWAEVAKSRGCHIFYTSEPDEDAQAPAPAIESLVRATCRTGSLIIVVLLSCLAAWLVRDPAVVYALLLTDLYLVAASLIAFLVIYHAVNFLLLLRPNGESRRQCVRYIVHFAAIALHIALGCAAAIDSGSRAFYFALPLIACVCAYFLLRWAKSIGDRAVYAAGAAIVIAMFIVIPLSMNGLQRAAAAPTERPGAIAGGRTRALTLDELGASGEGELRSAARENVSLLGRNSLYVEQRGDAYVFTNRTVMANEALARRIFDYLYMQAQADFGEEFTAREADGLTVHVLDRARTALFIDGREVCYLTAPSGTDPLSAAMLSRRDR